MVTQKPSRLKKIDWALVGTLTAILSGASLYYLQGHFVTREQYERDQTAASQMLREIRDDVKEIRVQLYDRTKKN